MTLLRNASKNYDYNSLQVVLTNKRLMKQISRFSAQTRQMKAAYGTLQDEFDEVQRKLTTIRVVCFLYHIVFVTYVLFSLYCFDWTKCNPDTSHINYFVEKSRMFFDYTVNNVKNIGSYIERDESL